MNQSSDFLNIAITAALQGGAAIMEIYDAPDFDPQTETKADDSPLTVADRKAHRAIMAVLQSTDYPVLSEEGREIPFAERRDWDRFWMVDPLDGTKEFIKRNGEFTVNVALIENGLPVLGAVYLPVKRTLYYGSAQGAFRYILPSETVAEVPDSLVEKGQPLPLKRRDGDYVIVASRSHRDERTEAYIREKEAQHPSVRIVSCGSSLKICLVAEGTADNYPRFGPTMEWDTAAADAVTRAAGVPLRDAATNRPMGYNKKDLHNPYFIAERVAD